MKFTTIDRLLVALNLALATAVVVMLVQPGGILRIALERWWRERRAERVLLEDWARIVDGAPTLTGDPANIKVVVFSDYECPFCRATYQSLDSINPRPLRAGIALRHLAFSSHPHAHRAAAAAICASEQGRFFEMNALLFTARLDSLTLRWGEAASASGVADVAKFLRCMSDPRTVDQVSADSTLAAELGIRATPTFVTKSGRFPGTKSVVALLNLLGDTNVAP